jgi:CHAT domain-containing protein/lipopolysaccharide biosynthesis regulator YciM
VAAQYQNLAVSHLLANEYEAALEKVGQAAGLYRSAQDWEQYFSCYNQIASIYLEMGQYEAAKRTAKKALWESIERLGRDNAEAAKAGHKLGEVYSAEGRYEDALESHRLATMIRRKLYGEQHPELADAYDWIGKTHAAGDGDEEAEKYYQRSLELRKRVLGAEAEEVATSFYLLGELAERRQQLAAALDYHRRALAIREKKLSSLDANLAYSCIQVGRLYAQQGASAEAVQNYERALEIWRNGGLVKQQAIRTPLYYLAHAYLQQGDLARARAVSRRLMSLSAGKNAAAWAIEDYQLGTAWMAHGGGQEAIALLERALAAKGAIPRAAGYHQLIKALRWSGQAEQAVARSREYLSVASEPLASLDAELQLGYSLLGHGEPEAALSYVKRAWAKEWAPPAWKLESLLAQAEAYRQMRDFEAAVRAAQEAGALEGASPESVFFKLRAAYLRVLAHSALARQDRNALQNLEAALEAALEADKGLQALLRLPLPSWQLDWVGEHQAHLYERAIQVCFSLKQQQQKMRYANLAFDFSERSKQLRLAIPLLLSQSIAYAKVPLPLQAEESALRREGQRLAHLHQLAPLVGTPGDQLARELADCRRRFDAHLRTLEQSAPAYYRLKYELPTLELGSLQAQLKSQSAVLYAYFAGKQHHYIYMADGLGFHFYQYPFGPEMAADLERFGQWLSLGQQGEQASAEQFAHLATRLCRRLLPDLPENTLAQLYLLPHGPLELLPFEALMVEAPAAATFATLPYLGSRYPMSYQYQAARLLEAKPGGNTSGLRSFLAFLPNYGGQKRNAAAAYAKSHAGEMLAKDVDLRHFHGLGEQWATQLSGEVWKGQRADGCGLRQLPPAEILLLAATAVLAEAPSNSFFALPNPIDSACLHPFGIEELYGMAQLAELGILPSSLVPEGVPSASLMHLARALQYNGCESLVWHRWLNPGPPSEALIQLFLERHQQGAPTAAALQSARQAYLQQQDATPALAHPRYWAGYMHFGTLKPAVVTSPVSPYWIIAGIGLLILVGWWAKNR